MVQPGAAGTVLNGCRVGGGDLLLPSDADVQITQPAVVQSVNPAMHRQLLSALPDVTHDGSLAYIEYLFDDVQLTEPVAPVRFVAPARESHRVFVAHVPHMAQPVVNQTQPVAAQGGAHAAATVMAAYDDVFDLQHIHGELHHRQTIQVRMHHHIGHVAVDEQFAGQQTDDLVGRHAAVRTAYPQIAGRLLPGEFLKKLRVFAANPVRPGPVVLKEVFQDAHDLSGSQVTVCRSAGTEAADHSARGEARVPGFHSSVGG